MNTFGGKMLYCSSACFKNKNIIKYIELNGKSGDCDYTDSKRIKVLSIKDIGIFIRKCLSKKYEYIDDDCSNYDFVYKYYFATIVSLNEVLKQLDFISEKVDYDGFIKDIFVNSEEDERYLKISGYPEEYNDIDLIVKGSKNKGKDSKSYKSWEEFKYILKHYNRYFEIDSKYSKKTFLDIIQKYLSEYKNCIKKNTKLYRSRVVDDNLNMSVDIENKIGPPPSKLASNNRMSPYGISYLYLSDKKMSSFSEIRVNESDKCILGEFILKNDLNIIDFTAKPIFNDDIFDECYNEDDNWIATFFSEFICEISKEVNKDATNNTEVDYNCEYVATQVISEFIRYLGYDGIKYYSSVSCGNSFVFFCGPELDDTDLPKIQSYKNFFEVSSVDLVEIDCIVKNTLFRDRTEKEFIPELHSTISYTAEDKIMIKEYNYKNVKNVYKKIF